MMREIRMEVVSDSEGYEMCANNNWALDHFYMGEGSNSGKLMMLAYERGVDYSDYPPNAVQKLDDPKDYIVCAYIDNYGSMMYWNNKASNHVSFNVQDAARYTKRQAESKVRAMRVRGAYNWKAVKHF